MCVCQTAKRRRRQFKLTKLGRKKATSAVGRNETYTAAGGTKKK